MIKHNKEKMLNYFYLREESGGNFVLFSGCKFYKLFVSREENRARQKYC
jgi:hypothetical protein